MNADTIKASWLRVLRGTVWEPGALDKIPPEFRSIFRFWLPMTDIIFMWFGYVGVLNGIGSVERATSPNFQLLWSLLLGIAATVALIGVAVPRLWPAELAAKTLLIALVSLYLYLFLQRGAYEPDVAATAGVFLLIVFFPFWRATWLGAIVWQKVWAAARRRKQRRAAS